MAHPLARYVARARAAGRAPHPLQLNGGGAIDRHAAKSAHICALTMQADMAEGFASMVKAPAHKRHFQRIAANLKRERERALGPVPADIAAMSTDELFAALNDGAA